MTLFASLILPLTFGAMSIDTMVSSMSFSQKADYKASLITSSFLIGQFASGPYTLDVKSIKTISGGVQVYAQAWENGVQLGFGDGTIDIERFRIFNPPVLVDNPNGAITRMTSEGIKTFSEDPAAALRAVLTDTVALVGKNGTKIVLGSVGNTTDVFFSSTDDGRVYRYATDTTWAAARDTTNGTGAATAETSERGNPCDYANDNPGKYDLFRSFFDFATSAIGSDTISSATFSFSKVGSAFSNTNSTTLEVVQTTHALPPTTSDFHSFTYTSGGSYNYSSLVSGYNDITLNATGQEFINKTGTTKIGMICGRDLNNLAPTGANDPQQFYFADQVGTTNDPKLTVIHAAVATPTSILSLFRAFWIW